MTIKIHALDTVPSTPGVYFFHSNQGVVLYVGKAKHLKKRVSQYFQNKSHNKRITQMISQIDSIEVLCTDTEHAALVLENQMIKKHKPKYNVLLKDDKNYPYIYLTKHTYPRVGICRGKYFKQCEYFGPYTSIRNLRYLLDVIQKLFKIRTCSESYFKNRSRACLLYQIGRCHGPCVEHVDEKTYAEQISALRKFLAGNYQQLIQEYAEKMHQASTEQAFEKAAIYRDTITGLQNMVGQQEENAQQDSVDIIKAKDDGVHVLVQHLWIRRGQIQDSKSVYMDHAALEMEALLASYLMQYYTQDNVPLGLPKHIICSQLEDEYASVSSYLSEHAAKNIKLVKEVRQTKHKHWCRTVDNNLQASYVQMVQDKHRYSDAFITLSELFNAHIQSIECIDISHTQGTHTYASCVYFNTDGADKKLYRTYKLVNKNDDYDSMRQTIERRYGKKSSQQRANVLLIDGGKGQLNAVAQILSKYEHVSVFLLAIAKNSNRKSGEETYFTWDVQSLTKQVEVDAKTRRLLETVRDEAHRFAITQHRRARGKATLQDVILELPGMGPKRYHALLSHFGSMNAIKRASVKQLQQVPGISKKVAEALHLAFM